MSEPKLEPQSRPGNCSYCADAQINHTPSFMGNFFSVPLDDHIVRTAHRAPKFLKIFVDWLSVFFIKIFAFLKIVKFSSDIGGVKSFRSRVIWEEARRRGIKMEQLVIFGKYLDFYRAEIDGKKIYFESIPIPEKSLDMKKNWDDKFILKDELKKHDIPIPKYLKLPVFGSQKSLEETFSLLEKPVIVKPKVGSRARHTITNIENFEDFKNGVGIARQISPYLVAEEHLGGYVCRATLVDGTLAGFYRGQAATILGDGKKSIRELIEEKDRNRPERVEKIRVGGELESHLSRAGHKLDDVLPKGKSLTLSHRIGRLFGGSTKEMIDDIHPSFIPIFEKASRVTDLAVVGFDAIIPDPTKPAGSQRWGIIECNTLPFIDLHYYALEGKPRNIAGMVWDLWK